MKNQNEGYSPSIAGWLARIFNVKESAIQRFLSIVAIIGVVLACLALFQKWTGGSQAEAAPDQAQPCVDEKG